MPALTILIIRHAEKPDPETPASGIGLSPQGEADDRSLTLRGWQRAGAWAALFGSGGEGTDFPRPGVVYAANPRAEPKPGHPISRRPHETILPLCERLDIVPVTTHGVGDEAALAAEVKRLSGTVLICWEHKRIADTLLPELAAGQRLPLFPAQWPADRFDAVLRFDRSHADAEWGFRQLLPRLLGGDPGAPLPG